MAYQIPGFSLGTEVAAADLSSSQYLFGVIGASGIAVAGAGAAVDGVINNTPTAGQPVELVVSGVAKVKAGAAVTKGATVAANASGQAIAATSTAFAAGVALSAAGAADEVISVLLGSPGHFALV